MPSTTPLGLALGPDSPPMDEPCRGTLRFSGHWILTNVFVTQADILTSASSTKTYVSASPNAERSPTDSFNSLFLLLYHTQRYGGVRNSIATPSTPKGSQRERVAEREKWQEKEIYKSHSFGRILSPGHCRRKNALPVSYYALFQGIAASKRTSWLFQHSHILFHLAAI